MEQGHEYEQINIVCIISHMSAKLTQRHPTGTKVAVAVSFHGFGLSKQNDRNMF